MRVVARKCVFNDTESRESFDKTTVQSPISRSLLATTKLADEEDLCKFTYLSLFHKKILTCLNRYEKLTNVSRAIMYPMTLVLRREIDNLEKSHSLTKRTMRCRSNKNVQK